MSLEGVIMHQRVWRILTCALLFPLLLTACSTTHGDDIHHTGAFTGRYVFEPPIDSYHIAYRYNFNTFEYYTACLDGAVTHKNREGVTHIDFRQGKGWFRPVGGTAWTEDGVDYSPYNDGGVPHPLDAMEEQFLTPLRALFGDGYTLKLIDYYTGNEEVLGVDCWVFDANGFNAIETRFWIDPHNGCCLRYEEPDGNGAYVTRYDLMCDEWEEGMIP